MVQTNIKWNLTHDKCFEIIHLTLIDILSESKDNIRNINDLILMLNSRTRVYKLHNCKKYNSFSKYLKIEYGGFLNFIESYNFYGVVKTDKDISIKLYKNLVNLDDLKYIGKRLTKDSEWIFIDDLGDEL
jgi:tRNA A22 N-methylase